VVQAVRTQGGQVQFAPQGGIVHATIAPLLLKSDRCRRNLSALVDALEQGPSGVEQGHLPAQDFGLLDDGHRRARRAASLNG